MIISLLVNLLSWIHIQNAELIGFTRGYEKGHFDAIEGKYTRLGWEMAGMIIDEAYIEANRIAQREYTEFLENMIKESIRRSID